MNIEITSLYAGLLALLILLLSYRVVMLRRKLQVGIGSHGEKVLARAIRVHGNAVEYIPICLLLMALAEIQGASSWFMHGTGLALLVGRVLHAAGLSKSVGKSFGRFYGVILTWLVMLVLSGYLIGYFIGFNGAA
ncbi:MAPEG family protein [Kangiella aquimarina]|uniref:MAPEG family protein n=1 Tax=Kangiella aquimarina TaxID=261965 RepID=A0ABZ0X2Y4_9GAMM|nr:MAPEG family protein [Kangiella aquimarina]WQG84657.1 MAPEG family protein [Kangiella aquimarina]